MCILKTEHLIRNYTMTGASQETNTIHVLKDIDFEVHKGEFVAIMGKSGCGKSTFLKLLGMIERPTAGTIYFDGMDTEELWKDELADIRRRRIGFVFQDFYLLDSLCVRDNILLPMILDKADSKVMSEKVVELAASFGIDKLLSKASYELSGGEKQRISIARAMLKDAPIVILDEATASIDPENEHLIQEAISALIHGKTIITIAHRLATIENADQILVIDGGTVAQRGTHKELLQQEGTYKKFIQIREQAEGWRIQ